MMKLFEILPTKFFNILASSNKEIYADCIFLIYKIMNNFNSFGVSREVLVDSLCNYFEGLENSVFIDEEEIVSGARNNANFIIRKLSECGWIDIETDNNYVQYVNLYDYAISFIETMDKLVRNERLEYQGYVYSIYTLLFSSENIQPSVMLEQVYENTKALVSGLKSLNSNIRNYIDKITKLKTAEEILNLQFNDYEVNIIDKSYHRLKTSDNVSKFRPRIIDKLEEMSRDSELIKLISKQLVDMEKTDTSENGNSLVLKNLGDMINALNNIDDIIRDIDHKHYLYLRSSLTRVKFILNSTKDLGGQINALLKYIVSITKTYNLDLNEGEIPDELNIFEIFSQSFIDGKSMYVSTEGKKMFNPQEFDSKKILTKEERKKQIEAFKLKNDARLNKSTINEYVLNHLGNKQVINASMLPLNEITDLIKIIYILVYSDSKLVFYKIKQLDIEINFNNFIFTDFEIWRK